MRPHAALLTVLAGAALAAVPAGPAAAAPCSSGRGVTVVVDFASLGAGTSRQCAAGAPASGVAALRGAGFTPTRAAQQPGYFVCRINGMPADDPCQRTSPANAYWSYWHAKPGGAWSYSSVGPADYAPSPGTVEGWAFGAGKPPSSAPPREDVAAPSPSPPAASHEAKAPVPAAGTSFQARPAVSNPAGASAAAPAAAAAGAPSPPPVPSSTPPPSPSPASSPSTVGGTVNRALTGPRSSIAGPLIAAAVVGLLLTGAAAALVRRRREERS